MAIRSPEQVVYEDCLAIFDADSNKLGQGTVKAKFFVRRGSDRDEGSLGLPRVAMELMFRDSTPMQDRAHGEVVGTFRIVAQKARYDDVDEIAEGLKAKFNATIYRSGTDTDYRPGEMRTDDQQRLVRTTEHEVEYSLPFYVYVVRQASSSPAAAELPQLHGSQARLTYTAGSGGVSILMGVVEGFDLHTSHPRVGVTPDTAPNTPMYVLGPGMSEVMFRAKVTESTSANSGTPNPRVPDGVAATLVVYKNGTSGQSWSMPVLVYGMSHGATRDGGQAVTYRLVRTGAMTETLQ